MMTPKRIENLRFMAEHNGMDARRVESMAKSGWKPSPEISALVIITTTELRQFLDAVDRCAEAAKEFSESMNEEQP